MTTKPGKSAEDAVARLLDSYVPQMGIPDELIGPDGDIRPVWRGFITRLARQSPERLAARMAHGEQYLRDAGVYYRRYDPLDSGQRDWPLSHVPVLIPDADWQELARGLAERADLLEQVVADLYGDNRLVAQGHLPAALVAQNAEWLRPLVGVKPASGHFLHFIAFDLGRGPQGKWWVIGDRTQAPSGAGFALENRMATSRIYSDIYRAQNVAPVSGFFRQFSAALKALTGDGDGRVGILTPGPMNETYFEHAFIARHLGIPLLQGEDLTISNRQAHIRTINGTSPVSVLWRRLDAAWLDPLELQDGSHLGTPGLLQALRSGSLTMVNAPGSGILETRALMAFLPRLSRVLDGRDLRVPNIATWWCGQNSARKYVHENADQMMIRSAYSTSPAYTPPKTDAPLPELLARLDTEGPAFVGQELAHLSTAPALVDGHLMPRPMSLRVFLARTASGWMAMPGGFARVGSTPTSNVLAMQQGGRVADVWIVRDAPQVAQKPAAPPAQPVARRRPAKLPSRAADNLFWLGRYVERAEHVIRTLRACHARLEESSPDNALVQTLSGYLTSFGFDLNQPTPTGLVQMIDSAVGCTSHVGDRFSVDGSLALTDLARTASRYSAETRPGEDTAQAMSVLLRKLSGFSGLVHENMYRFTGWRFLVMGRAVERAANMAGFLTTFADPDCPAGGLDLVIEIGDSMMIHHRRYAVAIQRDSVIDLLALDELNPRSVLSQIAQLEDHLKHLPGTEMHQQITDLERAVLQARADLALKTPRMLDTASLREVSGVIRGISDQISLAYLS